MQNMPNVGSKQPKRGQPGQGQRASGSGQGQPGQGHGQIRQSHRQLSQGQMQGQLGSFHGIMGHELGQVWQNEGPSGHGQGSANLGWGNIWQGQLGEGQGQSTQGQSQLRQQQQNLRREEQMHLGQKKGQSKPKKGQQLPGQVHGAASQGPSQSSKGHGPLGQVQGTPDHARKQLGQGQMGRGRAQPAQDSARTGQAQKGQAQRTLLQAQTTVPQQRRKEEEQRQPMPKKHLFGTQEFQDNVSDVVHALKACIDKMPDLKVRVELEMKENKEKLEAAEETKDALQKEYLELQFEHERLKCNIQESVLLNQELTVHFASFEKVGADLEDLLSSTEETLKEALEERNTTEHTNQTEQAEILTEKFSNIQKNYEHSQKTAMDRVKAAMEVTKTIQLGVMTKLAIEENVMKENSKLLKSQSEELQTSCQNLKQSIENNVRLEEINCHFKRDLEQTKEELNALKLEKSHQDEVERTLKTERQNLERRFAEKEREHTEFMTELQRQYDELQHEQQDQNLKLENFERMRQEVIEGANQRSRKDAEICDRLNKTIQELRANIDNMKTEDDNNNKHYKETREYADKLKQENASMQEIICEMEQHTAKLETVSEEHQVKLNDMGIHLISGENACKDIWEKVNGLKSELCQERERRAAADIYFAEIQSERKDLNEQLSRMANEDCELRKMFETTEHNNEELRLKIDELELICTSSEQKIESHKAHHQAKMEALEKSCTTLMKDLESKKKTLQKKHEQAINNAKAELSDCKTRIIQFEQVKPVNLAAEVEKARIRAEKMAQFKITEIKEIMARYKHECDQTLIDKDEEFASLNKTYEDILEKNRTINKDLKRAKAMKKKIAKITEELHHKIQTAESIEDPRGQGENMQTPQRKKPGSSRKVFTTVNVKLQKVVSGKSPMKACKKSSSESDDD